MDAKLYVVNGSHPCATVERALQLKGIPYKVVEFPPPMHMAAMKLLFGQRTVPGLKLDGEKISGSRAILRRLDELRPEPPLLPGRPGRSARASSRPRPGATTCCRASSRRILWPTFKAHPEAMATFDGLQAAGDPACRC